ncbi:MAG: NAAT family transporter [Chlamydiales bacterium]|nr:NAAT family transporter [Chlamydiales bacterium]
MTLFALTFSFFLLMDPLGNVPIFIALLKDVSIKRQKIIILRELIIALVIIIAFVFFGEGLLNLLHVSPMTIQIAGGLILFIIALKMIFPPPKQEFTLKKNEEPFLVPMAIPLVAGPSVLAAVMIYSRQLEGVSLLIGSLVIAWVVSAIILLSATQLKKVLGSKGISACERLMGLILILIAVEMFLDGFSTFLHQ